ncbi:hypothetical protein DEU56DRAFT_823804 [Suillus clintonianus]|uniref:uncharacterized protein n=1 Tax=Suillus clintonianus TaxID=1904413 RepID=UPI001B875A02|nr:uncharacterized protein DEU56DRAFT_823804 [Suillus clintonianus]KAG2125796.1 hypothetical protein DEU56DRAFT_823804 [Suillus clintonianus]
MPHFYLPNSLTHVPALSPDDYLLHLCTIMATQVEIPGQVEDDSTQDTPPGFFGGSYDVRTPAYPTFRIHIIRCSILILSRHEPSRAQDSSRDSSLSLGALAQLSHDHNPGLVQRPNSSSVQGRVSSLIEVLALSKLLQYGTNRHCLLLVGQNETRQNQHSSHTIQPSRHRILGRLLHRYPQRLLHLLLPRRVQQALRLVPLSSSRTPHGGFVFWSLCAAHLLTTP